ncbi:DUF3644 domain-containing protein [Sphingomonas sp. SUN019]|uniref:DUF3644 domain-containing protein n=1 Tax=Sphingomonas sp. SUN019 TaxID=2937788 RepID=UPI0021647708|nr:DUF3644 domain-containing protein [Sphingomonas sp. SUN019]UVO51349.1 DUF3644 domain-containing protein [Sphingomonas sp. SUN019]
MALTPSLTIAEQRIAKALAIDGERNQDIHILINIGRTPSVNFGRLSGVKDWSIQPATADETGAFKFEKSLVDLKTGLSPFQDERLVRSREAMMLAVQVFNLPGLLFKTELFSMLANVAWTYLLHEFYDRKGVKLEDKTGNTLLLSQMLKRSDCPLAKDIKKNLLAIKTIRDDVEHKILASLGRSFYPLFQANCLNFEEVICAFFGSRMSLGSTLSYALQFSKMSPDQIAQLQKYDLNPEINAINEHIKEVSEQDGTEGMQFQFKVAYSFEKVSKGDANIVFTNNNPGSDKKHEVVVQKVAADEQWPYKPMTVVKAVKMATGLAFSSHNHVQAWRKYGVRPKADSTDPSGCNKKFCTYHPAHGDYTYSQDWIDKLIAAIQDANEYAAIKAVKL